MESVGFFHLLVFVAMVENRIWLPRNLIKESVNNGTLEALNTFCRLRINKTPYCEYSIKTLCKQLNLSSGTLYRHLSFMRSNGLISINKGFIYFVGATELSKKYKSCLVPVYLSSDKKTQRDLLRYPLVVQNIKSQEKAIKIKENIINIEAKSFITSTELKYVRKMKGILINAKSFDKNTSISNNKFGDICNRSSSSGKRLQKSLNELGLIKSESQFKYIGNMLKINKTIFNSLSLGSGILLSKKGYAYQKLANRVSYFNIVMVQK